MEDHILLAHGNGGKLTSELIENCFLPYFQDPLLHQLNDQAIFGLEGPRVAFTTDSFVVDPLFFPGGDIGKLAVCGTVNDLAMGGATPHFLSIGFIIEENLSVETLKKISSSISVAAKEAHVRIVTADTKVVEKGACDKLFINTSGVGVVDASLSLSSRNGKAGDVVIMSGSMGDHGITIMTRRAGIALEGNLRSDTMPLHRLVDTILAAYPDSIRTFRDPTRGGVATTLNEIAAACSLSIVLQEDALPIRAEVRAACEILGLEPLYLANEGKCLAVVEADKAEHIVDLMKEQEEGQGAVIIGRLEEGKAGRVLINTPIGGSRVITPLHGDPLPRIC